MTSEIDFQAALSSRDWTIAGLHNENIRLSQHVNVLTAELNKLEAVHQHSNWKASQLQIVLNANMQRVQEAAICIRSKDETMTALQQEIKKLSENVKTSAAGPQTMDAGFGHTNERARQLESELTAERKKVQEAEMYLHSKDETIMALLQENIKLSETIKSLVAVSQKMEAARQNTNEKARQLESELTAERKKVPQDEKMAALQQENIRLLENLQRPAAELQKMEAGLKSANEKAGHLETVAICMKQRVQEAVICISSKDKQITALQQENIKLSENLQRKAVQGADLNLKSTEDGSAALQQENTRLLGQIKEMEAALLAESAKAKEADTCLAKQVQETSEIKATLVKMEKDLDEQQHQWEEEKCQLMANQQQRDEVEEVKMQLELQKAELEQENASLRLKEQENDQLHQDAARKVMELETSLLAEKARTKEADTCLAEKEQETSDLKAA
ncbi:CAP-Gly domain-containing linker protein 1-like [Cyprinodon tularosa]|uniref:CAP-Gly domain-containing linker protein 1-like n=1 Tax=Cyprinodon tularosa TaxID=77115 RepID=UPI0018E1E4E4|nr:CAP-Gly domain-containing linker protein 1-like [Cyprinodon tularosa]